MVVSGLADHVRHVGVEQLWEGIEGEDTLLLDELTYVRFLTDTTLKEVTRITS